MLDCIGPGINFCNLSPFAKMLFVPALCVMPFSKVLIDVRTFSFQSGATEPLEEISAWRGGGNLAESLQEVKWTISLQGLSVCLVHSIHFRGLMCVCEA